MLDLTKLIPKQDCALWILGTMELNRAMENHFAETEQVAFCTANAVPGLGFTDDPLLQGRPYSDSRAQGSDHGGDAGWPL